MKMTKTLLVTALAAAGLAATAAEAQNSLSRGSGGAQSGAARSGSAGANFGDSGGRGISSGIQRGDSGGEAKHGSHWNGRTVSTGGRHWNGGGRGHWGGRGYWHGSYWGPRFGLYFGAPLLFSSYYWGSPWWDDYYYPRSTVIYRDRIVEPYPMSVPGSYNEFEVRSTEVPRAEGAPTQAPAYRNYCESAKAYYPKVTKCPEGWRFEPTR
jgi:hypothetical protein